MAVDLTGGGSSGGGQLNLSGSGGCTTDSPIDLSGGESSSSSVTGGGPCLTCFKYTNILWVDPNGNNLTAVKGDIFHPWKTITSAQSSADSSDLIAIMPGTYTESGLGADNIQYYLHDNTVINGDFSASNISFSIHGRGKITNSGVTLSISGSSVIEVFDTTLESTADNAVVNMTGGTLNLIRANINNTSDTANAHGISTTITSSTYNVRLENMIITLANTSAEAIYATNPFSVLAVTDIGSTNLFNTNVTNYHPGTFLYTEPVL